MTNINITSDKQFLKNINFIWINRILLIVTPIFTTPIITNYFGLEIAGIWFLCSILASQLLLLEIGITTSLVRLLARPHIVRSNLETCKVICTAFYSLLFMSLILLCFSFLIVDLFLKTFEIPEFNLNDARNLFIIAIIYVVLNLPLRIGYSILASRHRFDIFQIIDSIGILTRLAVILVIFIFLQPKLFHLGIIVFGSSFLVSIISFLYSFRLFRLPKNFIYLNNFSFSYLKVILSMSGAAFIVTLSGMLLLQFSTTLIGFFLSLEFVSLVAIPILIFNSITPFFQALPTISGPIAAGISNTQDKKELFEKFKIWTKYTMSVSIIAFLGILILGNTLLNFWLGGEKVSSDDIYVMITVLTIIFFAYSISSIAPLARSISLAVGLHWKSSIIEITTSIVGIFVGSILLLTSDFGVYGMAIGISMALILRGFLFYPFLISNFFQSTIFSIFKGTIAKPIAMFLILCIIYFGLKIFILNNNSSLIFEIIAFIVVLAAWIFINTTFILNQKHRDSIKKFLT